jgi:hypothetical protein
MYQLISKNQVNEKQYSFLLPLLPLMQSAKNIAEISSIFERYVTHWWYALFEIAPKDENKENTQTSKSF